MRAACLSKWLAYSLKAPAGSEVLRTSSYGGTKIGLGLAEVGNVSISLPSLKEQFLRVRRIEAQLDGMFSMRAALDKQLVLLAERKQSLITAAVTGQIDVTTARGMKP